MFLSNVALVGFIETGASERLAMKWVNLYISAFGGDPARVTMCVDFN